MDGNEEIKKIINSIENSEKNLQKYSERAEEYTQSLFQTNNNPKTSNEAQGGNKKYHRDKLNAVEANIYNNIEKEYKATTTNEQNNEKETFVEKAVESKDNKKNIGF